MTTRPALAVAGGAPAVPPGAHRRWPELTAEDRGAVHRVLERRAGGAFNLAASPPITTDRIAEALGARPVHVPAPVVRAAMAAAWQAHLQQVDPGWLDLALAVPLLDTSRAARELDWSPSVDAMTVLRETLSGMRDAAADRTPVLRPRTVLDQVGELVRRGPIGQRQRP